MTDFPKISADALRFLERDGFAKGTLGAPYGTPMDRRSPTAHCVGGLLNMALSDGEATFWQENATANAVYGKTASIMRSHYEEYLRDAEILVPGEHEDSASIIAIINNDERFTEDDARRVFAELALASDE